MSMLMHMLVSTDEEIRVKITSTLKELKPEKNNFNYEKNDVVHIKSFGIEDTSINSSEWLNNTKSHYDVLSVEISDELENKYSINTYDNHHLNPGYKIILSDNFSNSVNGVITRVTSKNSFVVKSDEELGLDNTWKIENQILKTTSPEYNFLEKYIGNVQDTYSNFDGEVIVASNSIPVYDNTPLEPYMIKKIKFSGSASSEGTDIIDFGTITVFTLVMLFTILTEELKLPSLIQMEILPRPPHLINLKVWTNLSTM